MSKQKNPEKHGELQELVAGIRATEEEADRVKADFDSKSAELLKAGREKSVEMREQYSKKALEAKNRILSAERQKTEKLAQDIIDDGRKQASSLRSKKLDKKGVEAVFGSFVSSL